MVNAQIIQDGELTVPPWLSALVSIVFGSGVLVIAYQGWRCGELPADGYGSHHWHCRKLFFAL